MGPGLKTWLFEGPKYIDLEPLGNTQRSLGFLRRPSAWQLLAWSQVWFWVGTPIYPNKRTRGSNGSIPQTPNPNHQLRRSCGLSGSKWKSRKPLALPAHLLDSEPCTAKGPRCVARPSCREPIGRGTRTQASGWLTWLLGGSWVHG